jgi:hypothetical protein
MSPARLASAASPTDWPWLEAAAAMAELALDSCPAERQPRVATRTPAPTARSVTVARAFSLRTMLRWGVTDRAEDVAAVVSELLTNALLYSLADGQAPGDAAAWHPIRLGLMHPGPCVLCAVADPSTLAPVPRRPEWLDETGRGLQLIESLSDQWGFCPAPGGLGKVVWAAFATTTGLT